MRLTRCTKYKRRRFSETLALVTQYHFLCPSHDDEQSYCVETLLFPSNILILGIFLTYEGHHVIMPALKKISISLVGIVNNHRGTLCASNKPYM